MSETARVVVIGGGILALDVLECSRCGGRRRSVAVHPGGEGLRALLERLGLADTSPARAPSRSPPKAPSSTS